MATQCQAASLPCLASSLLPAMTNAMCNFIHCCTQLFQTVAVALLSNHTTGFECPKYFVQEVVIVGGLEMQQQAKALARRPHVVVATPGRLKAPLYLIICCCSGALRGCCCSSAVVSAAKGVHDLAAAGLRAVLAGSGLCKSC